MGKDITMNIIEWLQEWTKSQIDGDWEHEQGVQIDMYDNPGWFIKVDISNYIDFVEECKPKGYTNEEDWIDFDIKILGKERNCAYLTISGDINKLNKILYSFKAIIERLEVIEKEGRGILSQEEVWQILNDN